MAEKNNDKKAKQKNLKLPWKRHRLTLGQWLADKLTAGAGSWWFITGFIVVMIVWVAINIEWFLAERFKPWDPYPFILLNLFLSCLAAFQAPVILMSQNRTNQRDRSQAQKDYYINRKAEKEIKVLQIQLLELRQLISKQSLEKETKKIESEIKSIQEELENVGKTLQIE